MIEAAVSASRDRRHTSPDRTWARQVRRGVDGVRAHEESSASPSMQSCTASWRTVSRSTATITPPQAGHGGKDTRVDVSSTEAAGTGGGVTPSACRQRGSASVRQRGAKKP